MLNERKGSDMAVDMVSVVAGLALFVSPWLFGFSAEAAASWNAWIAGLLIAIVGVWTIASCQNWEEWLNLALGVWTLVSPWLLGFAIGSAVTMHVVVGLIVAALAIFELWRSHGRPLSAA
ncbi:MAG TPA: SPW repeat protein [Devosia sp.]